MIESMSATVATQLPDVMPLLTRYCQHTGKPIDAVSAELLPN